MVTALARLAERAAEHATPRHGRPQPQRAPPRRRRSASASPTPARSCCVALDRVDDLLARYPLRGIKGPVGTAAGPARPARRRRRPARPARAARSPSTSASSASLDQRRAGVPPLARLRRGGGARPGRGRARQPRHHHPPDGRPRAGHRGLRAGPGRLVGDAAQDEHPLVRADQRAGRRAAGPPDDGRPSWPATSGTRATCRCSVVRRVALPDAFFATDGLFETFLHRARRVRRLPRGDRARAATGTCRSSPPPRCSWPRCAPASGASRPTRRSRSTPSRSRSAMREKGAERQRPARPPRGRRPPRARPRRARRACSPTRSRSSAPRRTRSQRSSHQVEQLVADHPDAAALPPGTDPLSGPAPPLDPSSAAAPRSSAHDRPRPAPRPLRQGPRHLRRRRRPAADGHVATASRRSTSSWTEPIPDKGRVLTAMSAFWFDQLGRRRRRSHLVSTDLADLPAAGAGARRSPAGSMLCRKAEMLPIECIVRGYITGLGVEGVPQARARCTAAPLPEGLLESAQLPEPVFTPSTKAEVGDHDENISLRGTRSTLVGDELADQARDVSPRALPPRRRVGRRAGHHHRRHQVRARARRRRARAVRRGADARLVAVLARRRSGSRARRRRRSTSSRCATTSTASTGTRRPPPPPLPDEVVAADERRATSRRYERITGRSFADWPGAGGATSD